MTQHNSGYVVRASGGLILRPATLPAPAIRRRGVSHGARRHHGHAPKDGLPEKFGNAPPDATALSARHLGHREAHGVARLVSAESTSDHASMGVLLDAGQSCLRRCAGLPHEEGCSFRFARPGQADDRPAGWVFVEAEQDGVAPFAARNGGGRDAPQQVLLAQFAREFGIEPSCLIGAQCDPGAGESGFVDRCLGDGRSRRCDLGAQ